MNIKKTISKIVIMLFWIGIGSGMLLLLVAAVNKKNEELCQDVMVEVNSADENKFIDEKDIKYLVKSISKGNIKGEPVSSFNLNDVESKLEKNVWIKDAELYFDNLSVLNIYVKVRSPFARIITIENGSFYIDEAGIIMPLSDKVSARVPVFTGFPEKNKWDKKDSVLLNDIRTIATYINKDPFWEAQVSQIDITAERSFELIPVLGEHVVNLGTAENIETKLKKLFVFYKEVLTKSGFDKYGRIDLQYAGQIVGKPKGASPVMVDSLKVKVNVDSILNGNKLISNNTNPEKPSMKNDNVDKANVNKSKSEIPNSNLNLVKATQSVFEKNELKKEEKKTPKAVMPQKEN